MQIYGTMKMPEHWQPSSVVPSLSVILQEVVKLKRPCVTPPAGRWVMSNGSDGRALTGRHTPIIHRQGQF